MLTWLLLVLLCSLFAVVLRSFYREDRNTQQDLIRNLHVRMSWLENAFSVLQKHTIHYEILKLSEDRFSLYSDDVCLAVSYSAPITDEILEGLGLTRVQVAEVLCKALHLEVKQQLSTVHIMGLIIDGTRISCGYLYREEGLIKSIQFNAVMGDLQEKLCSLPAPVRLKIQQELDNFTLT